jgi:hypothetical protein
MASQTTRKRETAIMWFCEMRRMPRLCDCLYEVASELFRRLYDRVGPRIARAGRCPIRG